MKIDIKVCDKSCKECGFNDKSEVGVLKLQLGLAEVLDKQQLFPCHMILREHTGSENQGVEQLVADTGVLKVCYGYVASLKKSNIAPKYREMQKLMQSIDESTDEYKKVLTLGETFKYHKIGV